MNVGDFINHAGGIVICVTHTNTQGRDFKGYNLKSSNLKEGDYKTKNAGTKLTAREARRVFKTKRTPDNSKRWDSINEIILKMENIRQPENNQPIIIKDKKAKIPYVNHPVLA